MQRIERFYDDALYKSTFYLLTYLLTTFMTVKLHLDRDRAKISHHAKISRSKVSSFEAYCPDRHTQPTDFFN